MEQLFYQPDLDQGVDYLNEEESKHCIKVLRKKSGEPFLLTDGKGLYYDAIIVDANPRKCTFHITHKYAEPSRDFHIHLAISPTKNPDRLEWMVEKCVEIGIDKITFIKCDNTERPWLKTDRLKKVALSAMKQSKRATLPDISDLLSFEQLIKNVPDHTQRFIAYVDHANSDMLINKAVKSGAYVILIGPEGDFTANELELSEQYDFKKISLGNSRLRTETAGLVACCLLNAIHA